MIILSDLDGVVADWHKGFLDDFYAANPTAPKFEFHELHTFYLEDVFGQEWKDAIWDVMGEEGFYRSLDPIPGAIEGIALLQEEHDVRFCTAPISSPWCASEKFAWVAEHFGKEMATKTIVTKDKMFIRGEILLDDKPEIPGELDPEWQHVLYDQPYNSVRTDDNGDLINIRPRTNWEIILRFGGWTTALILVRPNSTI